MEVNWGIAGAGRISNDFANALVGIGAKVHAVAARKLVSAKEFATNFRIPQAYGSYEELCRDTTVTVIYVGTIHPAHLEVVTMALDNGKHVLCEKPIGLNSTEAKKMVALAREKKLLLLEGVWTRFFPVTKKINDMIQNDELGEIVGVQADFGFQADASAQRLFKKEYGGGGILDIGIYPLAWISMAFKGANPKKIKAIGCLAEGVDVTSTIALQYGDNDSNSMFITFKANTPEVVTIMGTKATVHIHSPAHAPTDATISRFVERGQPKDEKIHFDLPDQPEGLPDLIFPNSQGFQYQAKAVQDAIIAGKTELKEYSLDETLIIMDTMDEARRQLGVVYDQDVV